MAYLIILGAIIVLSFAVLFERLFFTTKRLPLPPGPKGIPVLGNVADLPPKDKGHEWEHWLTFKDRFGPISSITLLGQTIILMHDLEATIELLDKRGAKYSSRGRQVFAGELCGYNERMPFRSNNQIFRRQRKLAGTQLGTRNAITQFHDAMTLEVRRFLLRTLNRPENLVSHLETESGSLMLKTLYGYTTSPHTPDPLVSLINIVMEEFGKAVVVGAWLVDIVPWLRKLPDWCPGTGFKQIARQWKQDSDDSMNVPMDFVLRQMVQNHAKPSYVERLMRGNPDAEGKADIEQSAAALYAGGADSTAAALSFFFLAMTSFPEVQKRAREEIGSVIGHERLPNFSDRGRLPYIEAIIKETLRWHPLAPICPPHMCDAEDEFRGYRIPKGAMVLPSIKWFSMNPAVYFEPHVFRPERFLGPNPEPDPSQYAFGFGRRICPGRLLADANLFLVVAHSLAVFDINKAFDPETGRALDPTIGTGRGLVAHPLPWKCQIIPRSEKHAEMIRSIEIEHPWEDGDSELLDFSKSNYNSSRLSLLHRPG